MYPEQDLSFQKREFAGAVGSNVVSGATKIQKMVEEIHMVIGEITQKAEHILYSSSPKTQDSGKSIMTPLESSLTGILDHLVELKNRLP